MHTIKSINAFTNWFSIKIWSVVGVVLVFLLLRFQICHLSHSEFRRKMTFRRYRTIHTQILNVYLIVTWTLFTLVNRCDYRWCSMNLIFDDFYRRRFDFHRSQNRTVQYTLTYYFVYAHSRTATHIESTELEHITR